MSGDLEAAEEIRKRVDRLLRHAGAYGRYPTPVDDIVAAADLIEADDYVLDESLIQRAPAWMRALLHSTRSKLQGLVDRRQRVVHISPNIDNEGKRRFVLLHETTHDILPHQRDLLYADDQETLSPRTQRLFEREANLGAAELLFQRDHFATDAADLQISVDAVWHLAEMYGSSFHAALRRYTETHRDPVAAIVFEPQPRRCDPPTWAREEMVATPAWTQRFGPPRWPRIMNVVDQPLVAAFDHLLDRIDLVDLAGNSVTVRVDVQHTPYKNFLLLSAPKRRIVRPRRVRVVGATAS